MSEGTTATLSEVPPARRRIAQWTVIACILFVAVDLAYKMINNITYATRDKCILYRTLPRPAFLFFEYFVELGAMVMVGIFLARLLEGLFNRYKAFYPRNPVTAFLYGALDPFCACAVIPVVRSMRGKLPLRTTVTFIVAAPLLSPNTIMLSFTVLGPTYALLRIITSFIVAVLAGYVVERFGRVRPETDDMPAMACGRACCPLVPQDPYHDSFRLFLEVLPYVLIGGAAGMALELFAPVRALLAELRVSQGLWGTLAVVLVGLPLYLCNGTEVLLLRPLMHVGGISMGTAVAFSLTSTAICITSFIMLLKFLGTRATVVLTAYIAGTALLLAYLIDLVLKTGAQ